MYLASWFDKLTLGKRLTNLVENLEPKYNDKIY